MISLQHPKGIFNFRTVGILTDGSRVLLHRAEQENFWTLPGGRVEFGEDAAGALVREMQEELEVEVQIERLLWVVENFFEYSGMPYHEIAMYFLLSLPPEAQIYHRTEQWMGYEESCTLFFQWFPLDALKELPVYPMFLKQSLHSLPEHIIHIVEKNH